MKTISTLVALVLLGFGTSGHAADSSFDSMLTGFDYETRADMKVESKRLLPLLVEKKAVLLDIRFKEEVAAWRMGLPGCCTA